MQSTAPSVSDLVPVVPRTELLRFAPAAEERLDWHRLETSYYADAYGLGVPKDTAEQILRALMGSAEYQVGVFSRQALFELATATLYVIAPPVPVPTAGDQIREAVRAIRDRGFRTWETPTVNGPPGDRTMGTAWARYTTTRPALAHRRRG